MHIFIDDLERTLQNNSTEKLNIGTEKENTLSDKLIQNYLQKKFELEIDNKKTAWSWVGKENSRDLQTMYIYLSVEKIRKFKKIQFKNSLLTEIYNDQQNILQVNIPNKPQGYFVFDKGEILFSYEL